MNRPAGFLIVGVLALGAASVVVFLARGPQATPKSQPSGAPAGPAQRAAIPVKMAAVVERPLQDEVSFVAAVEPSVATTVGAEVDGRVVEMPVLEGDRVVAGTHGSTRVPARSSSARRGRS